MTAPIRVLFGNDNEMTLEAVSSFLESRGLEVIKVTTAADLYSAASSDSPDIIISDFDYGFGRSDRFADGVDIGIALREEGVSIPFIIYSGLSRPKATAEGFDQWSMDDVFELPDKINETVRGTDAS